MKIYRYRTISTTTYDEIINDGIWYSKFSELNDPFEGFYINNANDKSLDHLIKTFAVCCFSRIPASLLMWAHYGDAHRGLCLEYDIAEKDFKTNFMAVNYSAFLPKIDAILRYPADHPSAGGLAISIQKEGKAFTTKSEDWGYEKEIRTFRILEDPASKGEISKCPGILTSILFGLRTGNRNIAAIDRILTGNPELEFRKANLKHGSYEIEFQTVDRSEVQSGRRV